MPSRWVHNFINKLILGKEYDEVNRFVDFPYFLNPRKHRQWLHDPKTTPILVALLFKDWKAGLASYLHIKADKELKKDKFRKLFKLLKQK